MKGEPSRLIPQKLTAKLELLMKGTFNERNTFCNQKSIPYFFDCKARFFHHFVRLAFSVSLAYRKV